jgi:hypothetical protein
MNRGITLLAIAFFSLITFISCNKNTAVPAYSMKAKVGSDDYYNGNCQAIIMGGTLVIQGLNSNSPFPGYPYIELTIPDWIGLQGQYWIDSSSTNNHARYYADAATVKTSAYGRIIINSVSDRIISGTFNFTTTDSLDVSAGTFVAGIAR